MDLSTIFLYPTVATESPPLHATITMASHQNNPPPSAGSYASFASAQEHPETPGAPGTDGVSPSLPRILFDRSALPRLPSYLTHYINSTSATLNFQEVQEEEEECGRRDDDSVESAAEARDLTEALVDATSGIANIVTITAVGEVLLALHGHARRLGAAVR